LREDNLSRGEGKNTLRITYSKKEHENSNHQLKSQNIIILHPQTSKILTEQLLSKSVEEISTALQKVNKQTAL